MVSRRILTATLLTYICTVNLLAASVKVTMNSTAKVMTLVNKSTNAGVEVGEPTVPERYNTYTFNAPPGTYVLTGWDTDAHAKDYGTIELQITDAAEQEFNIFVVTATCLNYFTEGKTGWAYGTDWTMKNVRCSTREGKPIPVTLSNYTNVATSGNKYQAKYMLALSGTTYDFAIVPSNALKAEGYMEDRVSGTVTANTSCNLTFPMGGEFSVTFPISANFKLARKPGGTNGSGSIHYVAFDDIQPTSKTVSGRNYIYKYTLAEGTTYNYRLWKEDRRTKAGTFVYYAGSTRDGKVWADGQDGFRNVTFTNADIAEDAKWMNHDVTTNSKANVANIMLTVNERGHLSMKSGEAKMLGAQRDWQLTNGSTSNYFIEPTYHYTVLNLDGTSGNDVVTVTKAADDFSPWATLKANKAGSALVLVSYDAMKLTQITRSGKGTDTNPYTLTETDFYYGSEWSALWPENTGVFVVTVDQPTSSLDSRMLINEKYNANTTKLAAEYVDAEHDVFYYLKGTDGFSYTFKPKNVTNIQIAYPTLSSTGAAYKGFSSNGVSKNADGSYTLLLKHGRQIVCLTGTDGNKSYQVLTAKECDRTITNNTHTDGFFYPGDEIEIQYSGLYHPANKMSGIYNMSAYITYNGVPNGTELYQGKNQYQFCGTPSAQLVKVQIPSDWNPSETFVMNDACIQVTGFGDPIGNHRNIDPVAGRSPNFNAISHQTYFGSLPDVEIPVAASEYNLTIGKGGWSSFASCINTTIPVGVTAYYVTIDASKTAHLQKITTGTIAAGEGVIIKGVEGETATFLATTTAAERISGNKMVGVLKASDFHNNGSVFAITTKEDVTSFFLYKGDSFPIGKAYLDGTGINLAKISVVVDDDATIVQSATEATSYWPKAKGIYNLNGQKLSAPIKGVMIINGRKVIK